MNWTFLLMSYLSLLVLGLTDNIRGPVFSALLQDFQVSDFLGSWIFAGSSLMSLVGSTLSVRLSKNFHQYRLLQAALVLMTVALFVISQAPSFIVLLLGLGCVGMTMGFLGVAQNFLVTIGADVSHRSRVLSGLHAMYGLSSLAAPFLVASLTGRQWMWRDFYQFIAFLPLLLFLYSLSHPAPTQIVSTEHLEKKRAPWALILIAFGAAAYVVAEVLVSSRLVLFLQRRLEVSAETGSWALMAFFALMLLGRTVGSFIPLKEKAPVILYLSLILSLIFMALGLLGFPWFLVATGLTMAPFYPLAMSYMSHEFPEHLQKGVALFLGFQYVMLFSIHLITGRLSDLFGIEKALWLGPFFLMVALGLLALSRSSQKVLIRSISREG